MSSMTPPDKVRRYLLERGVRADLVGGGLTGLVERWTKIVDEISRGYQLTLDDYLNDMDLRDIIAGALAVADQSERDAIHQALETADRTLRSVTMPSSILRSAANPPNPENPDRWWYSRLPPRFLSE